jgi:SAM-dependent methyltransferases related to tRNA (uracil-5-)-methyltransferase
MKKVGGVAIESLPAYPSKPYGYRNKLVMPVSEYKGNIKTGFYEYNSHNIVATETCPLHADWADKLIKDVKQYMKENNERGYDYRNNKGDIRHIVARFICDQLLLVLVTNNPKGLKNYKALSKIIAKDFNSYGIYQSINTMDNNIVMGKTVDYLCGIKEIQGSACNKKFTLKPNSFFQINDEIRDVLYTTVRFIKTKES